MPHSVGHGLTFVNLSHTMIMEQVNGAEPLYSVGKIMTCSTDGPIGLYKRRSCSVSKLSCLMFL
jgi:hypothetical protein